MAAGIPQNTRYPASIKPPALPATLKMATNYYIQYHNADHIGSYPTANVDFENNIGLLTLDHSVKYDSWIHTRKKTVENAVGHYCFLIVGKTEKIKKYYLWSFFKIEEYEIDGTDNYVVYGHGYNFEHPIFLNELENFNDFKNFCGNFGIGFQNIDKHFFCKALASYSSPSYLTDPLNKIEGSPELEEVGETNDEVMFPSTQQYQDAIANALSLRQIEVLQILYSFPNASATAKALAKVLSPSSPSTIVASGQIGKIGKAICRHTGVMPPVYYDGDTEKPAYFYIVGEYFKDTGWNMCEELQEALENLNLVSGDGKTEIIERLPTETMQFDEQQLFKEGKVVEVFVNRHERNQEARLKCISHYGDSCYVCGFNFGQFYGDTAKGFIHVHHKTPLADIGKEYEVDPINDLIPLCANCHSVVHLTKPALTIEELKKLTKKSSR